MEGLLLAPAHNAERREVKKSTGQEQGNYYARGISSIVILIPHRIVFPTLEGGRQLSQIARTRGRKKGDSMAPSDLPPTKYQALEDDGAATMASNISIGREGGLGGGDWEGILRRPYGRCRRP